MFRVHFKLVYLKGGNDEGLLGAKDMHIPKHSADLSSVTFGMSWQEY